MTEEAPWIQSYRDKVIEPFDLHRTSEGIDIETIAHALSLKCRFAGQVKHFYSVAQHCVLGARAIAAPFALPFLLHEVSEVFLPDIPSPIKPFVKARNVPWETLEAEHAEVIFVALGLHSLCPLIRSPEVKEMDLRMLALEKRELLGPEPKPWPPLPEPVRAILYKLTPETAEQDFLQLYGELRGQWK
jgi:uncharacterized protein